MLWSGAIKNKKISKIIAETFKDMIFLSSCQDKKIYLIIN